MLKRLISRNRLTARLCTSGRAKVFSNNWGVVANSTLTERSGVALVYRNDAWTLHQGGGGDMLILDRGYSLPKLTPFFRRG